MQIDPTKWPKVEGSTSSPGYYFAVGKTAPNHVSLWCVNSHPFPIDDSVWLYGPIEFVPPKLIPPKPELVCIAACDAYRLKEKIHWAIIERNGKAWLKDSNGVVWCVRDYKIIDQ